MNGCFTVFKDSLNESKSTIGIVTGTIISVMVRRSFAYKTLSYSSGRKTTYLYEAILLVNESLRACISHDPELNFTSWGSF